MAEKNGNRGRDFSMEQVLMAIEGTAGIMSTIAKRLNCSWITAQKYVNQWATTRQAYQDESERVLDMAESGAIKLMSDGDGPMIRYYLSTKGRKRGYITSQEISGPDGSPLIGFIVKWEDGKPRIPDTPTEAT